MKNKGFTLIEVLAVITMLGLLALVVTPLVLEQQDKKEKELTSAQKQVLFSDAGSYVRDHSKYIIKSENVFCITVNTLIEEDYISMDDDEFKDNTIKVTVDENENFVYSIDNKCSENIES
ncbi:MAG: type II secretion system protein [Lactobacillales bacterium]|nr:type II secretion system protein [Lactobacillales bacterium]